MKRKTNGTGNDVFKTLHNYLLNEAADDGVVMAKLKTGGIGQERTMLYEFSGKNENTEDPSKQKADDLEKKLAAIQKQDDERIKNDIKGKTTPPYNVMAVEVAWSHDFDSWVDVGTYDTLDEALAVARKIVEASIRSYGSVEEWRKWQGDDACIYQKNRSLVWDAWTVYNPDLK